MSHGDTVTGWPEGFEEVGGLPASAGRRRRTATRPSRRDALKRYGFQFHPEVDDTVHGEEMLRNFVLEHLRLPPRLDHGALRRGGGRSASGRRRGTGGVFLLASGGVDSTVCAVLLGQALGPERVHLLHIDNGLMRKDESRQVVEEFQTRGLGRNLHFVDATRRVPRGARGRGGARAEAAHHRRHLHRGLPTTRPRRLGPAPHLLAQGTIYPDTIETGGTKRADTIKTHHNRVPIIEEMIAEGRVVEPLAELYKVEVRELGETLGLPEEMVWRHPFPGPGLGDPPALLRRAPRPRSLRRARAPSAARCEPSGLEAARCPSAPWG